MDVVTSYQNAVRMINKTPEMVQLEMEEPGKANFAVFDYVFPNGIRVGVGKSRRPSHASLYQLVVTDFNGKPNVKFPDKFAGEYTSPSRAEKDLQAYCKESWEAAEQAKTKEVRKTEAAKEASAANKGK